MYVIAAIVAFGILILIHELGHFTLAKLNGVVVEEFAIGMGPKLFGIKGKNTQYSIRILPFGGYVKMLGDQEKSDDPGAFNNKSPLQRLSIVIAGPIMNLILAVVLYCIIGGIGGFALPTVNKLVPDAPAAKAGLKTGDQLVKINGMRILTWEDFSMGVALAKDNPINLTVNQNGELKGYTLDTIKEEGTNRRIVGIYPEIVSAPTISQSIVYGFKETVSIIKQVFLSFKIIFTGGASLNDVGGPVTIIKITRQAAIAGIIPLLTIVAFLSSQLGILNLVPFPALDGSYVLICLYEIITGKPVDENKIGIINTIGFSILMAFMVLIIIKDIVFPVNF
ncbi:putative zinc metalloprotease CA [Clostridium pasteurianum DSM 525 = ATCC 6013]|uniref:Peptidase M50 n=1 Tax=Clostridium pasteurianum DSM 525 = ATCC 6013 TaxID=1262449 RepID=A0A0H3J875_CLOPA|nr:M50 family metallopeptidase [Clostridium pasteurianum]AJA48113.1 putative zinc metalloprotease CA [Clostridium pasteurianum DSM 525 = ATCC 6013]AJA52101.1 putative zinc metalloprotease CA [Clostridium pasteurianum DSM 525 = ATCC 6013]AOZ75380.1 RIP metalloprotease RseP [Clostridium pasteurianum DSM 525 = ATCC 6013]AOZ79175.1 RIP metalloprotease RseP [Clostridium pasteurianum]ELP60734.1 membrane-associated metalloprotease [Clostridium pasteurianum DSM 525 = ATCC 6013]